MENINVLKRDGSKEGFNVTKVKKVLKWACSKIEDVDPDRVLMNSRLNIFDNITSGDIHQILIDSAGSLIDSDVNYSKVAARLFVYKMRKEVWGGKNPPKLIHLLKKGVESGYYDASLLDNYSDSQINKMDEFIDHDRDFMFEYGGLVQLNEKYLVQNRKTGEVFETPQFAYILPAMTLAQNEPIRKRLSFVKEFYGDFSLHKINLSTPIMAGARTRTKSYSSCCIIDVDDTKGSLFAANTSAGMVTCDKYGVGLILSKIRSINEPIKGGETLHVGVIPWLKMYQSAIHSCQQGGARRGAGTVTFNIFHPQVESILQLKDNLLTEERKVEFLDYSICISNIFYKRLIAGEKISLCSYHEAPEVYDAFGLENFNEVYENWEKENPDAKKISAERVFSLLAKHRSETGRIYITNIDEANSYSAWSDKVEGFNLCQEVTFPLVPEKFSGDPDAEIGVCVLSATNMLNIDDDDDLKRVCKNIVRILDNIIDIQSYSVPACERFAKRKRSIGVGVTNLAGWLAEKGLNHESEQAPQEISDFLEKQQYYLLEASVDLAKERGQCEDFSSSKYSEGIMPVERYNKNVDSIVSPQHTMDWDRLRKLIAKHGLRNCTVSAFMPVESSSVIQGSSSGIDQIRDLISYKTSKTATTTVIAPNSKKNKDIYLRLFDSKNNTGHINCVAAVTKWSDMGVSGNMSYDPQKFNGGNIPQTQIIQDILTATKLGWRTFYYHNTYDGDKEEDPKGDGCDGGACSL